MREYRARLVTDVITGRLDVREAAANLTDKADYPDRFDDADASGESGEETEDVDLEAAPEDVEA